MKSIRGDGKDRFYRTLRLDAETRETLKEFRKIKKKMMNDNEDEEIDNE